MYDVHMYDVKCVPVELLQVHRMCTVAASYIALLYVCTEMCVCVRTICTHVRVQRCGPGPRTSAATLQDAE